MIARAFIFYALTFVLLLSGCIEREVDYTPLVDGPNYSLEEATDVQIFYSDSAKARVSISGPTLKRYVYKFRVEEEFPDGVHVEFYDEFESPSAWLDARYALRKPTEKKVIARDSVVLYNSQGSRIESSELIWDEREQTLSTERFVQIIRPPGDTIYSYGFKTNQNFSEYELYSVEGNMSFRQFDSSYRGDDQ